MPGSARATPLPGRGDVRAVDEKLILIHARTEGGHEDVAACRGRRRDARRRLDPVVRTEPSHGDGVEVLGAEASPESGVSSVDARARSVDHDRVREACQRQDRRSLDGGACPNADVGFAIGGESLQLDVEHVRARGQRREAQLALRSSSVSPPPISAGELMRTQRTRKGAALCVLDRADEGSRQPLRDGDPWNQDTPGQQENDRPRPTARHVRVHLP